MERWQGLSTCVLINEVCHFALLHSFVYFCRASGELGSSETFGDVCTVIIFNVVKIFYARLEQMDRMHLGHFH